MSIDLFILVSKIQHSDATIILRENSPRLPKSYFLPISNIEACHTRNSVGAIIINNHTRDALKHRTL